MATAGGDSELCLSDESFDVCCTTCSKKKLNKQAISYCTDCDKNLCCKCLQVHDEFLEGHTLVDVHDADQNSVLTEKCDKHKEEIIKLFCADHDDVVCSLCAMLEHRKCQDLKHIADFIGQLEKDPKTTTVPRQLKSALQDIECVIVSLDQHLEILSEREHTCLEEIEEYTKKLLAKIVQMKADAEKEVITKHKELATSAIEKRTTCLIMKKDISKTLKNMKASKKRKANLFVLTKRGEALIKNLETLCQDSEDLMKGSRLAVRLDKSIESYLNAYTAIGTVKEKYKVTLKGSVDVSVKGDRNISCDIEECFRFGDGTVLLFDYKNDKLKHIDPSTSTIIDQCELKGYLRGITPISPQEVAIATSIPGLQIASLCNKLSNKSTLPPNHDCRRLVQSRGELFVADGDIVYVHDVTGKLHRTVCKDESGEKMFSDIRGIAVDNKEDMLYVADLHKGLICVGRNGQEEFRRSEKDLGLSGVHGVCTDKAGNVFVCGHSSNSVVQVSEDGRVVGEILSRTHGLAWPRCVCFDPNKDTLYVVGMTSKFLMFKLQ